MRKYPSGTDEGMIGRKLQICWLIALVLLSLSGCSAPPSKGTVEAVIINHFAGRSYRVTKIDIGDIDSTPAGKKQYMGTEGYIVQVPSLTLEYRKDSGEHHEYKKGQQLTFHNAVVSMKRGRAQEKEWIITNIAGVPLL